MQLDNQGAVSVYFAAPLFKASDLLLNATLTEKLEASGRNVRLPQRDGFEFSRLHQNLAVELGQAEAGRALQTVIYLADMGRFIADCDVVIAVVDEPVDEGVVVEISHANLMGKLVIGLRTDARAPYGSLEDPLKGMHFFPAYQCQEFIYLQVTTFPYHDIDKTLDGVTSKINSIIDSRLEAIRSSQENIPNIALIEKINERAKKLFEGIEDLHDPDALRTIARRYMENKAFFDEIAPRVS